MGEEGTGKKHPSAVYDEVFRSRTKKEAYVTAILTPNGGEDGPIVETCSNKNPISIAFCGLCAAKLHANDDYLDSSDVEMIERMLGKILWRANQLQEEMDAEENNDDDE